MKVYPVGLVVEGKRCVVIGGGRVAARKTRVLIEAGAWVEVISPEVVRPLAALGQAGRITLTRRAYHGGDLKGAALAIAATDDQEVNVRVAEAARGLGIAVNVADDPGRSSFLVPATLRRGELVMAVFTGGKSPALARELRMELQERYGPEYGALLELLHELHSATTGAAGSRGRRFGQEYSSILQSGILGLLRRGDREAAGDLARRILGRAAAGGGSQTNPAETGQKGIVYLVGAGPGDPGLLTVQGRECIARADMVVYDRLVAPQLLEYARPEAELVYVGKATGYHPLPQEQITSLLIQGAMQGKVVTRLKGGDPYLFGRGGEEAEALARAGLAFEVIPGVTSAVAVPAAAGIPVTHRGLSSSVAVLTAHPGAMESTDWASIARGVDTLVFLMGMTNLATIARRLMENGLSPATPTAVVQWGSLPWQVTVTATLATIEDEVRRAGLAPPAVIVVGKVVQMRARLGPSAR